MPDFTTKLPCGLTVKFDNDILIFKGDSGCQTPTCRCPNIDTREFIKIKDTLEHRFSVDCSINNLEAISDFFAHVALLVKKEEEEMFTMENYPGSMNDA
jgi:hypothetical protein